MFLFPLLSAHALASLYLPCCSAKWSGHWTLKCNILLRCQSWHVKKNTCVAKSICILQKNAYAMGELSSISYLEHRATICIRELPKSWNKKNRLLLLYIHMFLYGICTEGSEEKLCLVNASLSNWCAWKEVWKLQDHGKIQRCEVQL